MLKYSKGQNISVNLSLINNDGTPEENADVSYILYDTNNTIITANNNITFNKQLGSYIDIIQPWENQQEGIYYLVWQIKNTIEDYPEKATEELYIESYDEKLDNISNDLDNLDSTTSQEILNNTQVIIDDLDNLDSTSQEILSNTQNIIDDIGEIDGKVDNVYNDTQNIIDDIGEIDGKVDNVYNDTQVIIDDLDNLDSTSQEILSNTQNISDDLDNLDSTSQEILNNTQVIIDDLDNLDSTSQEILSNTQNISDDLESKEIKLDKILGLVHSNTYIDEPSYDQFGNLVGAKVTLYSNSSSVGTDKDVLATYKIEAEGESHGKLVYWKQVEE